MQPAGDLEQLDRLVTQHLPLALRFATRLTGTVDAAEEIVQDALLRATSYWNGLREPAAFRSWLYRIIVNVFRDSLRRRQVTGTRNVDDRQSDVSTVADRSAGPQELLAQREFSERVADCVSRLPERQREVLVLMTYENCTADEAASILQISVANVYSTLHVARTRLKQQLLPYLQDQC